MTARMPSPSASALRTASALLSAATMQSSARGSATSADTDTDWPGSQPETNSAGSTSQLRVFIGPGGGFRVCSSTLLTLYRGCICGKRMRIHMNLRRSLSRHIAPTPDIRHSAARGREMRYRDGFCVQRGQHSDGHSRHSGDTQPTTDSLGGKIPDDPRCADPEDRHIKAGTRKQVWWEMRQGFRFPRELIVPRRPCQENNECEQPAPERRHQELYRAKRGEDRSEFRVHRGNRP